MKEEPYARIRGQSDSTKDVPPLRQFLRLLARTVVERFNRTMTSDDAELNSAPKCGK